MSLRDEREEFEKWFGKSLTDAEREVYFRRNDDGDYRVPSAQATWAMWQPAYQSATERALRIVDQGIQLSRDPGQTTLLMSLRKRIKGDSNGNSF